MISLSPAAAAFPFKPWRRFRRRNRSIVVGNLETSFPPSSSSLQDSYPPRAVVIGGGLAGLAAANRLHSAGVPVLLLESSDGVGGRVRTDLHEGFLLDRGFQIFITAYPEAKKILDYSALDLQKFYSGALVYAGGGRFHRVADPLRHPIDGLGSLLNPVGTVADKFLVGLARFRAAIREDRDILSADEVSILSRLRDSGFSPSIVDQFFRPFFGGVFFDRDLETTSRLFDFVFKCLALGDNTLPSRGISAIPEQLASSLPPGSIRLNTKAVGVGPAASGGAAVKTAGGEVIAAEIGVVVAADLPEAARLLPWAIPLQNRISSSKPPRSTTCLYFSADRPPLKDPILLLNGTGKGRVNNMFFATNVAPSYAPPGKTLVSISLIGASSEEEEEDGRDLVGEVLGEMGEWFGASEVEGWRHLRTYRIPFAQPDQSPPTEINSRDLRAGNGVYLCGDYMSSATFDGALVSGRMAAEALIGDRFPSGYVSSALISTY